MMMMGHGQLDNESESVYYVTSVQSFSILFLCAITQPRKTNTLGPNQDKGSLLLLLLLCWPAQHSAKRK